MTRQEAVKFLIEKPYKFGHLVGFTKLTPLHNQWLIDMIKGKDDKTLQASRGSYKTTCVSIALALCCILYPNKRAFFLRKTDSDVKEIIKQVRNILLAPQTRYFVSVIYGVNLKLLTDNQNEIQTNLTTDYKGTSQLVAQGIGGSITGKHFDRIWTDDIVNIKDRTSKAERDNTKLVYQELQNIKNRGGRIYNTGTPWHKDDCFQLMPNIQKFDCYECQKYEMITADELSQIKKSMIPSLFSANYELRHIASDDVLFGEPHFYNGENDNPIRDGICHVDASYGGSDRTAATFIKQGENGKLWALGRIWAKHIDNCIPEILELKQKYAIGRTYCEDNGDKGYLKKRLREMGDNATSYHESMNKFVKISTYLYKDWDNIQWLKETDKEYLDEICDYNEQAEHDDAPDTAASICRLLSKKNTGNYESIF